MLNNIISRWDENNEKLKEYFKNTKQSDYCQSYLSILKAIVKTILPDENISSEIIEIDHGEYQGTLIFILHKEEYQPSESDYFITSVSYGSCSVCDTLQAISVYHDDMLPTEEQVGEYMSLALHMVQKMKSLKELDG